MCTTNNNKKTKKKYTHPPLEDSRKLEDFTCLEYSERLIDYEGNIGYSNEGFPVDVVEIDFGNGERMFLPANNYEVNIKLQKYGDQITLTIRAVNLSTGECKVVTQSHICHDALQSYPSQFLSTKGQRKNQFPMNSQSQFNSAHAYYKPATSYRSTLQFSSYDEPKISSSGSQLDAIDYTNNTTSATGTVVGAAQFAVGTVKNQSLWNASHKAHKLLKSNGINVQTKVLKHGLKPMLANASRKITYIGAALSVGDVLIDGRLNASHVLNMTMVGVSAIPVVGWIAGGVYFTADMVTLGISGQSIGGHLDDYVGEPLVNDIYDW